MEYNIETTSKHTENQKRIISEKLHNQINEYKIERVFGNQSLESCVRKMISAHLSI